MGRVCCVTGCNNTTRSVVKGKKVVLHRFPADRELSKVWKSRVGRKDFAVTGVTKNTRLCSVHFKDGKRTPDVDLPTIFPHKIYKIHKYEPGVLEEIVEVSGDGISHDQEELSDNSSEENHCSAKVPSASNNQPYILDKSDIPRIMKGKRYCCVVGCHNNSGTEGVKLHRIPQNESVAKIWMQRINRINFTANLSTRLCSAHFKGGVYKQGMLPSIFPDTIYNTDRIVQVVSEDDGGSKIQVFEYEEGDFVHQPPEFVYRRDSEDSDLLEREQDSLEQPLVEGSGITSDEDQLVANSVLHADHTYGIHGNNLTRSLHSLLNRVFKQTSMHQDSQNEKTVSLSLAKESKFDCGTKNAESSNCGLQKTNKEHGDIDLEMDCDSFKEELLEDEMPEKSCDMDLSESNEEKVVPANEDWLETNHVTFDNRTVHGDFKKEILDAESEFGLSKDIASSSHEYGSASCSSRMGKIEKDIENANTDNGTDMNVSSFQIKQEIDDSVGSEEEPVACDNLDMKSEPREEDGDNLHKEDEEEQNSPSQSVENQLLNTSVNRDPPVIHHSMRDELSDTTSQPGNPDLETDQIKLGPWMREKFKDARSIREKVKKLRQSMLNLCGYLEHRLFEDSEVAIPVVNNILKVIEQYCASPAPGNVVRFNWCGPQKTGVLTVDVGLQTHLKPHVFDEGSQTELPGRIIEPKPQKCLTETRDSQTTITYYQSGEIDAGILSKRQKKAEYYAVFPQEVIGGPHLVSVSKNADISKSNKPINLDQPASGDSDSDAVQTIKARISKVKDADKRPDPGLGTYSLLYKKHSLMRPPQTKQNPDLVSTHSKLSENCSHQNSSKSNQHSSHASISETDPEDSDSSTDVEIEEMQCGNTGAASSVTATDCNKDHLLLSGSNPESTSVTAHQNSELDKHIEVPAYSENESACSMANVRQKCRNQRPDENSSDEDPDIELHVSFGCQELTAPASLRSMSSSDSSKSTPIQEHNSSDDDRCELQKDHQSFPRKVGDEDPGESHYSSETIRRESNSSGENEKAFCIVPKTKYRRKSKPKPYYKKGRGRGKVADSDSPFQFWSYI